MGKLPQPNPKSSSITNNNSISSANNGVTKVKRTRRSVPRDSPPQRSSIYRGVTRHRWTGRYEAHLWDKNCWNESQNKKGRQVYLGAYDDEEAAAHAYDLAALKYWGPETILNFPLSTYEKELKEMDGQSREEYIGSLRRKSSGFSRGVSKYRGVARHHHNGRWEARIGRVFGNKYLYLGTYATQEEAATAYDMAAIEYRGLNAVTNFDLSRYIKWLKPNQNNSSNINNGPNSNITTDHSSATTAPLPKPDQDQDQDQDQDLGLTFFHNQQQTYGQPQLQPAPTPMPSPRHSNATSALGLLLQSAKFKEMMEMTAVADHNPSSDPTGHQLFDRGAATPHSFPKDVQTYFECEDLSRYGEGSDDQMFFGELNSFIQPMFQCDFGALLG